MSDSRPVVDTVQDGEEEACAALQHDIRQEEALLRTYRAELRLLQREQERIADDVNEKDDDDGMALEDLLLLEPSPPHQQSQASMTATPAVTWNPDIVDSIKEECWEMTQSLQGFVMESVDHLDVPGDGDVPSRHDSTATTNSPQHSSYIIQGHFVVDPSVSASFRLTTERRNSRGRKRKFQTKNNTAGSNDSRVVRLQASLVRSGQKWSQVEALVAAHAHPNNLGDWIFRMGDFLEFDKRQTEALRQWQQSRQEKDGFSWTRSGEEMGVRLFLRGEGESRVNVPLFIWKWDWAEQKDTLSMELPRDGTNDKNNYETDDSSSQSTASANGLDPQGLQDLVEYTGSCEKALGIILKTINDA